MIPDSRIGNGVTGGTPVLAESYRIIFSSTAFLVSWGLSPFGC